MIAGVYYQTFMLAPHRWRLVIAWVCGFLYVVGNISITLSVTFGTTTFLVACINVFEKAPGVGVLSGEPYQVYLIFLGVTLFSNAVTAFGNKWLPVLDVISSPDCSIYMNPEADSLDDRRHILDLCWGHCSGRHHSRPCQRGSSRREVCVYTF